MTLVQDLTQQLAYLGGQMTVEASTLPYATPCAEVRFGDETRIVEAQEAIYLTIFAEAAGLSVEHVWDTLALAAARIL